MSLPPTSGELFSICIVWLHTMQLMRSISGLLSSLAVGLTSASPSAPAFRAGGVRSLDPCRASESNLHRATVKGKLHSRHSRVRENAEYGIGIEDFQTQISARRHDFRCACGLKIDGIARLLPRLDLALDSSASDVISLCDKAATEVFGELSKADFIGFLDENVAALVLV